MGRKARVVNAAMELLIKGAHLGALKLTVESGLRKGELPDKLVQKGVRNSVILDTGARGDGRPPKCGPLTWRLRQGHYNIIEFTLI